MIGPGSRNRPGWPRVLLALAGAAAIPLFVGFRPGSSSTTSEEFYYFVHVSKAAGVSFEIDATKTLAVVDHCGKPGCLYSLNEDLDEPAFANGSCNFLACEGELQMRRSELQQMFLEKRPKQQPTPTIRTMFMLRHSTRHIISMYLHCQQRGAQGHELYEHPQIEFAPWLQKVLDRPSTAHRFCSYNPENMVTKTLARSASESPMYSPSWDGQLVTPHETQVALNAV